MAKISKNKNLNKFILKSRKSKATACANKGQKPSERPKPIEKK